MTSVIVTETEPVRLVAEVRQGDSVVRSATVTALPRPDISVQTVKKKQKNKKQKVNFNILIICFNFKTI